MYKICTTCKKHKALWTFTHSKAKEFGVAAQCKMCRAIYNFKNRNKINTYGKKYRCENKDKESLRRKLRYKNNKEKELIYSHKYYKENINNIRKYRLLNRERHMAYCKKHYQENKERYTLLSNQWQKDHPKEVREYKRMWKKKNKHIVNKNTAKRRAIKYNQTPSDANENKINFMYSLREIMCKNLKNNYHVDHIIPLNRGGLHHQNNLQIILASENLMKQSSVNSNYRGTTLNDINLCIEIIQSI